MAAASQSARPSILQPQVPRDAVRIACCRCIDGSRQAREINTRQAAWSVAGPGSTTFQPAVPANNAAWAPVAPAGWIGAPGAPIATGDYTYRLIIYVPPCTLRPNVVISGRFAADNSARLYLDNTLVRASQGTPDYGFLPNGVTPFSTTITTPGLHVLRLVANNSGQYTGAIVQATIVSTCPSELETGGIRDLEALPANQVPDTRAIEPQP